MVSVLAKFRRGRTLPLLLGLLLFGNESQTVGPEDAPKEVHLLLLGAGMALLEGVVLDGVEEGKYFLNAVPLKTAQGDGAPCRAWLLRE